MSADVHVVLLPWSGAAACLRPFLLAGQQVTDCADYDSVKSLVSGLLISRKVRSVQSCCSHRLLWSLCAFNKVKLDKFPAERSLAVLRQDAFPALVGTLKRAIDHILAAGLVIGADLNNS